MTDEVGGDVLVEVQTGRPPDGIVDGARYLVVVERYVDSQGVVMQSDRVLWVTDAYTGFKMDVQILQMSDPGEDGVSYAKVRSLINSDWVEHDGLDPVRVLIDRTTVV